MANDVRISTKPIVFYDLMKRTDDRQLEALTPPSTLRYTLFGWTADESSAWTALRIRADELYVLYSDPDKTGPAIRKKMKELINETRAYDNDKATGHHLFDMVALHGNIDDCIIFNVKRGTVLAEDPVHHADEPVTQRPQITIIKNEEGMQMLEVTNPDTPNTKKLPEGMAFAKVYRYIGFEYPHDLKLFEFVGNAKRGKFLSTFVDLQLSGEQRMYAYYFARYESKKGRLGAPSIIEKAEIMLVNS